MRKSISGVCYLFCLWREREKERETERDTERGGRVRRERNREREVGS